MSDKGNADNIQYSSQSPPPPSKYRFNSPLKPI